MSPERRAVRKARKHSEALVRNERTPHERTRAHRNGLCGCDPAAADLLRKVFTGTAPR